MGTLMCRSCLQRNLFLVAEKKVPRNNIIAPQMVQRGWTSARFGIFISSQAYLFDRSVYHASTESR